MKKSIALAASAVATTVLISCGGNAAKGGVEEIIVPAHDGVPEYAIVNAPQVDLDGYEVDEEGFIKIFNGKDLEGWRGYGKDRCPSMWTVEDGCLKFNGAGGGEAQQGDGGDIIFARKFKNFELRFDWKVEKGANSGVFYLAREVKEKNDEGDMEYAHIYLSSPEYQILDNENHPDARLGKTIGIRQSSSLYDMIIAEPQNAKPWGEWNSGSIMVYEGTVVHGQNGENVLEYHMWTPEWTKLINSGKFAKDKSPLAFELLNNCGGDEHEGYIGFQDHGDVVYYRNIRVKIFD